MDIVLLEAYSNTTFKVFTPALNIRIGEKYPELDLLLTGHSAMTWAFITAENPYSRVLTSVENEARMEELNTDLADYVTFQGEGVGEDPAWLPEKSLLVLGISQAKAAELGRKYEQNAIVFGQHGEPAQLMVLVAQPGEQA